MPETKRIMEMSAELYGTALSVTPFSLLPAARPLPIAIVRDRPKQTGVKHTSLTSTAMGTQLLARPLPPVLPLEARRKQL